MEQNEDTQARTDEELRRFCLEQAVKAVAHRDRVWGCNADFEQSNDYCKTLQLANKYFAYVREGKTDEPDWYYI